MTEKHWLHLVKRHLTMHFLEQKIICTVVFPEKTTFNLKKEVQYSTKVVHRIEQEYTGCGRRIPRPLDCHIQCSAIEEFKTDN